MKMMELEVWVGNCAKAHCGTIDSNLVNVAIRGLSFVLPNGCCESGTICFTDYKKACFYLDDWCDIVCGLAACKFVNISCKVHFQEDDNVRTMSAKVCGDLLECLANDTVIDFEALDGGIHDIEVCAFHKKPMVKFTVNIGIPHTPSKKFCGISESNSGIPHDDISEKQFEINFDNLSALKRYMQVWCDVFTFFGRGADECNVCVHLNIESLHRVYKFDTCIDLLTNLEQSYSTSLRHFPI